MRIPALRATVTSRATFVLDQLRVAYLMGAKGTAPAGPYLNKTRPVYEYVRLTLCASLSTLSLSHHPSLARALSSLLARTKAEVRSGWKSAGEWGWGSRGRSTELSTTGRKDSRTGEWTSGKLTLREWVIGEEGLVFTADSFYEPVSGGGREN